MLEPKIFIGPMSLNVVDSVIEYCNDNNTTIGLIPSRRQIDHDGGYVNNWKTKEFSEYVKSRTNKILLVRDHGGPGQGENPDDGLESLKEDCKYFDIIHIDPWKVYNDYESGLNKTIELILFCNKLNPNILFEVGTEQSIRPFTPEELESLLSDLKSNLGNIFNKIKYAVIQSGTELKGNNNIGVYDKKKLIRMCNIVKKYGLKCKEHNGDYLTSRLINEKFSIGLESINIAPEFGQVETKCFLNNIKEIHPELIDKYYNICFNSMRWVKWVSSGFNPNKNKEEIINICGHYILSDKNFLLIKNTYFNGIDDFIKKEIKKNISSKL